MKSDRQLTLEEVDPGKVALPEHILYSRRKWQEAVGKVDF